MNVEQDVEVGMWPEPATSGQHVGMPKGVKVTHKPTGIIVICDTERSQHANRQKALDFIARALEQREGWRPIESAPRDGSCVLLAGGGCVTPGFWHDGSECYGHRGGAGFFDESDRGSLLTASNFDATHWMPPPAAPKPEGSGHG